MTKKHTADLPWKMCFCLKKSLTSNVLCDKINFSQLGVVHKIQKEVMFALKLTKHDHLFDTIWLCGGPCVLLHCEHNITADQKHHLPTHTFGIRFNFWMHGWGKRFDYTYVMLYICCGNKAAVVRDLGARFFFCSFPYRFFYHIPRICVLFTVFR